MNARYLLLALLLIPGLPSPGFAAEGDPARLPSPGDLSCPGCNVILLNIELLRADHVGLISGTDHTPNVDRFFRNGIVLHDVSAPAGETFLSNTAVLTVTPPHRIGIRAISIDRYDELDPGEQAAIEAELSILGSVTEVMRDHGYVTVGINQGGRAGEHVYLDRGFREFSQWSSKLLFEDLASLLLRKLDEHEGEPVFVLFRPTFLHQHQYRRPDIPESLDPAAVRSARYEYRAPGGTRRQGVLLKRMLGTGEEAERAAERRIYAEQLAYGDSELSRVFDVLDDRFAGNSIIVLYANHGSGLGDNGIFRHGTSYQSSIHVPVLIRHPGIDYPVHVEQPASLLDLVPTLYRMLGIANDKPPMVATYDELILGPPAGEAVLFGRNSWDEYVRLGDWKLIIEYDRIRSLYNLEDDPGEERDLYRRESPKAKQLEALLLQYRRDMNRSR